MPAYPRPGRRIVVVGTTGSGKTAMASQLARRLGCAHVELDALHWGPGWSEAPAEVFRERARQAVRGRCWVVDGNYSRVRDIVWPAADTMVWLDYPLPVILWRLMRRTLRRTLLRTPLWNGNRERFTEQFFSRKSLLFWALQTYRRRRIQYPELLRRPEHAHLAVIRLRSPREARRWLAGIETPPASGGPT